MSIQKHTICSGAYETPVYVNDSGTDGPVTFVTAGVHGDEKAGRKTAKALAKADIPNGKLVVLPTADAVAAKKDARNGGRDYDLNRVFPANGAPSTPLAKKIMAEIARYDVDWFFDLHTSRGLGGRINGGPRPCPSNFDGVGQMCYTFNNPRSLEVADTAAQKATEAFGLSSVTVGSEKYDFSFMTSASVSADGDAMLADGVFGRFRDDGSNTGVCGAIVEVTEDATSVSDQTQRQKALMQNMMAEYDQRPSFNAEGSNMNAEKEDMSNNTKTSSGNDTKSKKEKEGKNSKKNKSGKEDYPFGKEDLVVQNKLTLTNTNPEKPLEYKIRVAGKIAPTKGGNLEKVDAISTNQDSSTTLQATLEAGGMDAIYYDGAIYEGKVPDAITVKTDGSEVGFDRLLTPKFCKAEGKGAYSVTVNDNAAPAYTKVSSAEANDTAKRNDDGTTTITGSLNGGADIFYVDGKVLKTDIDANVTVTLDGSELKRDLGQDSPKDGSDGADDPAWKGPVKTLQKDVESLDRRVTALEKALDDSSSDFPPETWGDIPTNRIYHAVDDIKLDNSGEELIDPKLNKYLGTKDHVAVYFPEGTYRVGQLFMDNPAMEFHGSNKTTLLLDGETYSGEALKTAIDCQSDGGVVNNFEIDFRETDCPPQIKVHAPNAKFSNIVTRGDLGVRDYATHMEMKDDGISLMHFASTETDGRCIVENVYSEGLPAELVNKGPDTFTHGTGTTHNGVRDNRRAIWCPTGGKFSHEGSLEIRNCHFEHYCENTLYSDYCSGTVHIDSCYIKNSPIGLRLPGGSSVRNTTIVKDGPVPWQRATLWDNWGENAKAGTNRMRGMMNRGGKFANPKQTVTYENLDIVFTDDEDYDMGQPFVFCPPTDKTVMKDIRVKLRQRDHQNPDVHDRWPALKLDSGPKTPENPEFVIDGVYVDSDSKDAVAFEFGRKAYVSTFKGKVSCPAGYISQADGDVLETLDEMDEVKADEVPAADGSSPIPSYPPVGKTPAANE